MPNHIPSFPFAVNLCHCNHLFDLPFYHFTIFPVSPFPGLVVAILSGIILGVIAGLTLLVAVFSRRHRSVEDGDDDGDDNGCETNTRAVINKVDSEADADGNKDDDQS